MCRYWRWPGQKRRAQYEYNDERENRIIISCQSHTDTLKVSPGNQPGQTGRLGDWWPSAPDFILIRGQPSITVDSTVTYNQTTKTITENIELSFLFPLLVSILVGNPGEL